MFRGDQLQAMHEIEVVEANDIIVFVPISIPRHTIEALGPIMRSALNPVLPQLRLFCFPRNLDYRQILAILIICLNTCHPRRRAPTLVRPGSRFW